MLIKKNIDFPRTHSLNVLSSLLMQHGVLLPENILDSIGLTIYAVQTRYPGEYDEITKEDYEFAKLLAKDVLEFVRSRLVLGTLFID